MKQKAFFIIFRGLSLERIISTFIGEWEPDFGATFSGLIDGGRVFGLRVPSWAGYLGWALVFVWDVVLRGEFNFYFSGVFW